MTKTTGVLLKNLILGQDVDTPDQLTQTVSYQGFEEMNRLVGCDTATVVRIPEIAGHTNLCLWLDDEGLVNTPCPQVNCLAMGLTGYTAPLVGRALVINSDDEGEEIDVPQEVIDKLRSGMQAYAWYTKGLNQLRAWADARPKS